MHTNVGCGKKQWAHPDIASKNSRDGTPSPPQGGREALGRKVAQTIYSPELTSEKGAPLSDSLPARSSRGEREDANSRGQCQEAPKCNRVPISNLPKSEEWNTVFAIWVIQLQFVLPERSLPAWLEETAKQVGSRPGTRHRRGIGKGCKADEEAAGPSCV